VVVERFVADADGRAVAIEAEAALDVRPIRALAAGGVGGDLRVARLGVEGQRQALLDVWPRMQLQADKR